MIDCNKIKHISLTAWKDDYKYGENDDYGKKYDDKYEDEYGAAYEHEDSVADEDKNKMKMKEHQRRIKGTLKAN